MLKKARNKWNIFNRLREEYGMVFSIRSASYYLSHNDDKYIKLLTNYLKQFMQNELLEIEERVFVVKGNKEKDIVWSMWWQGENSLPEILKVCYESHKRYIISDSIEYIFITKENYKKYADIPDYIIEKVNKGIISFTHFSDLLRVCLIEKYGGAWIDITLLLASPIDRSFLDYSFYSFNLYGSEYQPNGLGQKITQCKWSGFMLSCCAPYNPLFVFLKKALFKFWKEYNYAIDYFLLNCLIRIAYENNKYIKKIVDTIPINNNNLYAMQPVLNDAYSEEKYKRITSNTTFFKLTQKKEVLKESEEITSFYGYIFRRYFAD